MGFRSKSRATIWWCQPQSDTMTKVMLSTDGKTKDGEWKRDFSDFVTFLGTAVAKKASALKKLDHIIIGDCEVKYTFDENGEVKYKNYYIYSFEMAENKDGSSNNSGGSSNQKSADEGIDHNPVEESRLPF